MAVHPAPHRFTVEEYHRMVEVGLLHPDDRVELLQGEIVDMASIGSRHAACVNRLNEFFVERLRGRVVVSPQHPVVIGDFSEPEPDVALLQWRDDRYASGHPQPEDVLLLVEVADTSIGWDRRRKVPLYAGAGVVEVWLVDLKADSVDIHRNPAGGHYLDVVTALPRRSDGVRDRIAPQLFPEVAIDVAELFPS